MSSALHGVVVVDKPSGMTSARVVGTVKRMLNVKKIGHTGTLDPMATGVLPLCIGEGTKVAGYLLAEDKVYEGELLLGVETDTLDREGRETARDDQGAQEVDEAALLAAMAQLRGPIEQIPPMYSALKKDGRRLHELARKGVEVERAPRNIIIHSFELLSFADRRATFAVKASKGTYVRSLVLDLGRILGCGAHLTELRRTESGTFGLAQALTLEQLRDRASDLVLTNPAIAIAHLPQFTVPEEWVASVADGKRLPWQLLSESEPPSDVFALLTSSGQDLLAIAVIEEERLRFRRVFNYGLTREAGSYTVPAEIV